MLHESIEIVLRTYIYNIAFLSLRVEPFRGILTCVGCEARPVLLSSQTCTFHETITKYHLKYLSFSFATTPL